METVCPMPFSMAQVSCHAALSSRAGMLHFYTEDALKIALDNLCLEAPLQIAPAVAPSVGAECSPFLLEGFDMHQWAQFEVSCCFLSMPRERETLS